MDNTFTLLGIADSELHLCRLLRRLLECTRVPREPLLAALLGGATPAHVRHLEVRTEVPFGGSRKRRRADLVVHWSDDAGGCSQLVIETKIFAGEGKDQTRDYVEAQPTWDRLRAEFVADHGLEVRQRAPTRFVFLTLFGETASAAAMSPLSLLALTPALRGYAGHGTLGRLAGDYAEILETSVDSATPTPDRTFADQLRSSESAPLDARFVLFRHLADAVVAQLGAAAALRCVSTYRASYQARTWFGAQLARPHWRNEFSPRRLLSDFDPRRDFWLHFQICLVLPIAAGPAAFLELGFYDELLPYQSREEFRRSLANTPDLVAVHARLRKERVLRAVAALRTIGWVPRGRSNQVAAWPARIAIDTTLPRLVDHLAPVIAEAADRIDAALAPLLAIQTPPR
jgi:hypothetical protein